MELLERSVYGGLTVWQALVAVVVLVGLSFAWSKLEPKNDRPSLHHVERSCPACGWLGSVSKHVPRCPKCGGKIST
ncbi:MAG: hypothetical protein ACHREM_10215 [Polyangiales bacterium]